MADIQINCPHCEQQTAVSEYIAADSVPCPHCGRDIPLKAPASLQPARLKLRQSADGRPIRLNAGTDSQRSTVTDTVDAATAARETQAAGRKKSSAPKQWPGWIFFIVLAAGLGALQYGIDAWRFPADWYSWARLTCWPLILLLGLVTAFRESTFKGLAALFIPGYVIYYIYAFGDSFVLRGAMSALLAATAMELYFIPDAALINIVQQNANSFIESTESMLDRVSN